MIDLGPKYPLPILVAANDLGTHDLLLFGSATALAIGNFTPDIRSFGLYTAYSAFRTAFPYEFSNAFNSDPPWVPSPYVGAS